MLRIRPILIPRALELLSVVTAPEAWDWLLAWWQTNRHAQGRHPQTIELKVTAYRDDVGVEPILPRPKMRTFRRMKPE